MKPGKQRPNLTTYQSIQVWYTTHMHPLTPLVIRYPKRKIPIHYWSRRSDIISLKWDVFCFLLGEKEHNLSEGVKSTTTTTTQQIFYMLSTRMHAR
jgi:hypothetical protein